jgi:hypothetical protein
MSPGVAIMLLAVALVAAGAAAIVFALCRRSSWILRAAIVAGGIALLVAGARGIVRARQIPHDLALGACRARLAVLAGSLRSYQRDHGVFPESLAVFVEQRYATDGSLRSPLMAHVPDVSCDYAYVRGLEPNDPWEWPLVFDAASYDSDGRRNVGFLSGQARTLGEAEFEAMLRSFASAHSERKGYPPDINMP